SPSRKRSARRIFSRTRRTPSTSGSCASSTSGCANPRRRSRADRMRGVRFRASAVFIAALFLAFFAQHVAARGTDATVALSALPPEAQDTVRLVRAGGPFPYARDGVVFGNREGLLPAQRRGYYHEYTV